MWFVLLMNWEFLLELQLLKLMCHFTAPWRVSTGRWTPFSLWGKDEIMCFHSFHPLICHTICCSWCDRISAKSLFVNGDWSLKLGSNVGYSWYLNVCAEKHSNILSSIPQNLLVWLPRSDLWFVSGSYVDISLRGRVTFVTLRNPLDHDVSFL